MWAQSHELLTDAVEGEDGQRQLAVGLARLRMTHLQREQRPVAHTEATLADVYLRRDRAALADYQKLVADVLRAEVEKARAGARVLVLTHADLAEAATDPAKVATRNGVSPAVLDDLMSGRADTALTACADNTHSPFGPADTPCQASFLKCLSCPCARSMPHHLPTQIAAREAIGQRKTHMTALRWAQRFALVEAQLNDVIDSAGPLAAHTGAHVTEHDRALVERLLRRELDQP